MARLESEVGSHAHHPQVHFGFLLKQRNVFRVGALYVAVCWLVLDPVYVIFHMLEIPIWANRLVVILMVLGFPAALLFAWIYEITPTGLKRAAEVAQEKSVRGRKRSLPARTEPPRAGAPREINGGTG